LSTRILYIISGLSFTGLFLLLFLPNFKKPEQFVGANPVNNGSAVEQASPFRPDEYFRYVIGTFSGEFARTAAGLAMRNKLAPLDSLDLGVRLARENNFYGLSGYYLFWKARRSGSAEDYYQAAVDFVRAANSGEKDRDAQALATEWTMGENCADSALRIQPNHIPARNVKAVVLSEYRVQPMEAVALLRENEKRDSTNIETHYIYLSLLKKAGELDKAIRRCEKLISLQPRNPEFLYEMSGLYGMKGDSLNARVFLDLAVKVQRNAGSGIQ
jgi:tetratricopeptide (TPR) repeat protein